MSAHTVTRRAAGNGSGGTPFRLARVGTVLTHTVDRGYPLAEAKVQVKEIPGIGMAEWGPGDMALSLGVRTIGPSAVKDPLMVAARAKVLAACKANHIAFLNSLGPNDVIDMIKEGVMVGPASPETAAIGRKYTNRPPPY